MDNGKVHMVEEIEKLPNNKIMPILVCKAKAYNGKSYTRDWNKVTCEKCNEISPNQMKGTEEK